MVLLRSGLRADRQAAAAKSCTVAEQAAKVQKRAAHSQLKCDEERAKLVTWEHAVKQELFELRCANLTGP